MVTPDGMWSYAGEWCAVDPDPKCAHAMLVDKTPPYHGPATPDAMGRDGVWHFNLRLREWECADCGGYVPLHGDIIYRVDGNVARRVAHKHDLHTWGRRKRNKERSA